MSQQLVNRFLTELEQLKKISGTRTENVVSEAFKDLLKSWSRQLNLTFIAQLEYTIARKTPLRPDGTILHDLRVPLGYWEAKDTDDELDREIEKKFAKGYPQDNIIFENSHTAVLIQNGREVMRCPMAEEGSLSNLLKLFFSYERAEIRDFRKAVEQFKTDIPAVLDALREKIDAAYATNKAFKKAADKFLKHAKDTINPAVTEADVREMLIQHILTEEIFDKVFGDSEFHRQNNIAKELYTLEGLFFTGSVKRETLKGLEPYYATIRANAALISSHNEKQTFLKVIYENFYKVYNPKAADRLGVVYTPNEIVKFMIEGADWLCEKHFSKNLIDRDVEILDPATGTGTFICELLESFRGQPQKLALKYKEELHANEVAILPYYVANLNIEATYAAISGQFAEFPNLCFVDTLDNVAGLGIRSGHQHELFGALSEENVERVKRQNRRKISVIIGNPPYNANQANENDNNKNREYPRIDQRIRDSYIKQSTAQKTKLYDMYARFFRWASDRLHDDGILAFITNRSFIDSRTFDGFRKSVTSEFDSIYVVDLGGDWKSVGVGGGGNVFGIGTGVAISFWVKKRQSKASSTSRIVNYAHTAQIEAEEKLSWLSTHPLSKLTFSRIEPDELSFWTNQQTTAFENELPIASKSAKAGKIGSKGNALFKLFSLGVVTNRDDWVYGSDQESVISKVKFLIDTYEKSRATLLPLNKEGRKKALLSLNKSIKWTRAVKKDLLACKPYTFDSSRITDCMYRPFSLQKLYFSRQLNEMVYLNPSFFGEDSEKSNTIIKFSDSTAQKPFMVGASNIIADLHFVGAAAGTVCLGKYRYSEGTRIDNITDWGLKQFQSHYEKGTRPKRRIGKDDIFDYVYGVLHDPVYRETYAINLKREFPRIPFYPDFWKWAAWGKRLMELHIGYETVEPWPLTRQDAPPTSGVPKVMLKADKTQGTITLDSATTLSGIPPHAFAYRLGNRSALEWVLDQHKEKKPKDPTIAAKFNTYRFKDYKEKVVDLITRVTRVSVETMEIVEAMREAEREG
jgi:predicted helicase